MSLEELAEAGLTAPPVEQAPKRRSAPAAEAPFLRLEACPRQLGAALPHAAARSTCESRITFARGPADELSIRCFQLLHHLFVEIFWVPLVGFLSEVGSILLFFRGDTGRPPQIAHLLDSPENVRGEQFEPGGSSCTPSSSAPSTTRNPIRTCGRSRARPPCTFRDWDRNKESGRSRSFFFLKMKGNVSCSSQFYGQFRRLSRNSKVNKEEM